MLPDFCATIQFHCIFLTGNTQNQKKIYYQEGFYTNEEFVLVGKLYTCKTIKNEQTVTMVCTI